MIGASERYIVDENGARIAVILPIAEYERLLDELEEQDDIRAYDEAMAADEVEVPLEQVIAEMERNRRQHRARSDESNG